VNSPGARLFLAALLWLAGSVVAPPALTAQERAADAERARRVLILYSDRAELPANAILGGAIRTTLDAGEAIAVAGDGPREITIETRREASCRAALLVRDTGIGVKDPDLERIFQHFVSSKPDGLGMGLAISRSIVQAHGGRIWATANPARGLTVHVELPGDAEPA
jgi:C4-dicarboxylate-specific signal transduction histidine kinase